MSMATRLTTFSATIPPVDEPTTEAPSFTPCRDRNGSCHILPYLTSGWPPWETLDSRPAPSKQIDRTSHRVQPTSPRNQNFCKRLVGGNYFFIDFTVYSLGSILVPVWNNQGPVSLKIIVEKISCTLVLFKFFAI